MLQQLDIRLRQIIGKVTRTFTLLMVAFVTLLTVNILGTSQAQAIDLLGPVKDTLCASSYVFDAPESPSGGSGVTAQKVDDTANNFTSSSGNGTASSAYGAAGLYWQTGGSSLCDGSYLTNARTTIENIILAPLISSMQTLEGFLTFIFTAALPRLVFSNSAVNGLFDAIYTKIWLEWGGLLGLIGIIVVLFRFLDLRKSGIKEAFTGMIVVSFGVGGIIAVGTTPWVKEQAVFYHAEATALSSDISAALAGDCETAILSGNYSQQVANAKCIASTVINDLVEPIINYGYAGEAANSTAYFQVGDDIKKAEPGKTVKYSAKAPGSDKDLKEVTLPVAGVVPTDHENPTISDYLRWTQTYTFAEKAALKSGAAKTCPALNAPISDLEDYKDTLCGYKWRVRAALLHGLAKSPDTQAFKDVNGSSNNRIALALMSYITAGINISALNIFALINAFYQLDYVVAWLSLIFVLFALVVTASFKRFADWLGQVAWALVSSMLVTLFLSLYLVISPFIGKAIQQTLGDISPVFAIFIQSWILLGLLVVLIFYLFKFLRKASKNNKFFQNAYSKAPTTLLSNQAKKMAKVTSATTAAAFTGGVTTAAATFAKTATQVSGENLHDKNLISVIGDGAYGGRQEALMQSSRRQAKQNETSRSIRAQEARRLAVAELGDARSVGEEALQKRLEESKHLKQEQDFLDKADEAAKKLEQLENDSVRDEFNAYAQTQEPGKHKKVLSARQSLTQAQSIHAQKGQAKNAALEAHQQLVQSKNLPDQLHELVVDSEGKTMNKITETANGNTRLQDPATYDKDYDINAVLADPDTRAAFEKSMQSLEVAVQEETEASVGLIQRQKEMETAKLAYDNAKDKVSERILSMSDKQIEALNVPPATITMLKRYKVNRVQTQQFTHQVDTFKYDASTQRGFAATAANEAKKLEAARDRHLNAHETQMKQVESLTHAMSGLHDGGLNRHLRGGEAIAEGKQEQTALMQQLQAQYVSAGGVGKMPDSSARVFRS